MKNLDMYSLYWNKNPHRADIWKIYSPLKTKRILPDGVYKTIIVCLYLHVYEYILCTFLVHKQAYMLCLLAPHLLECLQKLKWHKCDYILHYIWYRHLASDSLCQPCSLILLIKSGESHKTYRYKLRHLCMYKSSIYR